MGVHLRLLEEHEGPAVVDLFRRAFGGSIDLKLFEWKYRRNPQGPSIEAVAEDSGRIVGFYGMQATTFLDPDGQPVPTYQETDLMVDPASRGQNLFARLGTFAYEEGARRGAPFTYGFPNSRSTPVGKRKLGWRVLQVWPLWSLYLRARMPGRLAVLDGLLGPVRNLPGTIARRRAGAGSPAREIPADRYAPPAPSGIATQRSEALLRWRLAENPLAEYRCLAASDDAAMVLFTLRESRGLRELVLVDAFGPVDKLEGLLPSIIDLGIQAQADVVRCWAGRDTALGQALAGAGFLHRPGPNLTINLMAEGHEAFLDPANWAVTVLDSDTA